MFRAGPGVRDSRKRTKPSYKQRTRADCSLDNERTHCLVLRNGAETLRGATHTFQSTIPLKICAGLMISKHTHRPDPINRAQISANLRRRLRENPGQRRVSTEPRGAVRVQMVLTFAEMSDPESTCVSAIACVNKIKDG